MRGVDRQRREHREDALFVELAHRLAVVLAETVPRHDLDALGGELGLEHVPGQRRDAPTEVLRDRRLSGIIQQENLVLASADPREMAEADCVVIWGTNPVNTQVNVMTHVARARKARGAKLVVAPCHNCWDAIRDLEEVYKIGIRWTFLKPLLLSMVEVPEELLPQEE